MRIGRLTRTRRRAKSARAHHAIVAKHNVIRATIGNDAGRQRSKARLQCFQLQLLGNVRLVAIRLARHHALFRVVHGVSFEQNVVRFASTQRSVLKIRR